MSTPTRDRMLDHPIPTPAECIALHARIHAGDDKAAGELVRLHMRTIIAIVSRGRTPRANVDDVVMLAVQYAVEYAPKWVPSRYAFNAVVVGCAKRAIIHHALEFESIVRRRQGQAALAAKKRRETGKETPLPSSVSLSVIEGTLFDESGEETDAARGPDEHAAVAAMVDDLLSPRDADIVRRVAAGESYTDAGAAHGLTRERARQIEFKSMRRLRAAVKRREWSHIAELKKSSATL